MKRSILFFIKCYQRTISLDHGPLRQCIRQPRCRFHPTCSEYAYEAINRFGVIKGSWLAGERLGRCHPWTMGGLDPVPSLCKKNKRR